VVSSDSDDDVALVKPNRGAGRKATYVVDSASEEVSSPVLQRKRARRVIDDDDDDE
jgi:hypothetical protein